MTFCVVFFELVNPAFRKKVCLIRNVAFLIKQTFSFSSFVLAQQKLSTQNKTKADAEFFKVVGRWFAAWEMVRHDVYGINKLQTDEFVFFLTVKIFIRPRM